MFRWLNRLLCWWCGCAVDWDDALEVEDEHLPGEAVYLGWCRRCGQGPFRL